MQTGGGVRTMDDAVALADTGVARVVMGSAAVADPHLVDQVARSCRSPSGSTTARGSWPCTAGPSIADVTVSEALDAVPVGRRRSSSPTSPGTACSAAPTSTGSRPRWRRPTVAVIASGGVGSLDDVRALAAIAGLHGIIAGRALYEGRFTVAEAVEALAEAGSS